MDDFVIPALKDSRYEWASRLINILSPHIIDGIKSIFDDSVKICKENNESEKYLMTFQNFISRIPKWNDYIIEAECTRIVEKSQCKYLEDLITCVHIVQLKILSAIRVGSKQKKIEINVPKVNDFIHKIYVNVGRKVYKNAYLFEMSINPMQRQKNMAQLDKIVQECIVNTIREGIPVESLLKAYMAEGVEDEVTEEIKEVIQPAAPAPAPVAAALDVSAATPPPPPPPPITEIKIPEMKPYVEDAPESSLIKAASTTAPQVKFDESTIEKGPVIGEEIKLNFDVIDLNPTSDNLTLKDPVLLTDVEILS